MTTLMTLPNHKCATSNTTIYEVWSKTTVNAAAECDPTERQESSIREAARRTLVTVRDKFQLVQCSQSVVSYSW